MERIPHSMPNFDKERQRIQTEVSRQRLGNELAKLGPVKMIEALRFMQRAYRSEIKMVDAEDQMETLGFLDNGTGTDRFMALTDGYLDDREEWDHILDSMPKGEENAG